MKWIIQLHKHFWVVGLLCENFAILLRLLLTALLQWSQQHNRVGYWKEGACLCLCDGGFITFFGYTFYDSLCYFSFLLPNTLTKIMTCTLSPVPINTVSPCLLRSPPNLPFHSFQSPVSPHAQPAQPGINWLLENSIALWAIIIFSLWRCCFTHRELHIQTAGWAHKNSSAC